MWDSVSDSLDDFCRPVSDFWVRLFLAKYISIEAKTYVLHTETIGLLLHHSVLQKETTTSALFQCFCTASPTRTHTRRKKRREVAATMARDRAVGLPPRRPTSTTRWTSPSVSRTRRSSTECVWWPGFWVASPSFVPLTTGRACASAPYTLQNL